MGFLSRISLMLAPLLIVVILLELKYENHRNYIDVLFEKADAIAEQQILLVGNSHVGALGLGKWNKETAINLSIGGQDLFHASALINYILSEGSQIRKVYLGFDYSQVGYNLEKGGQLYMDRQYYPYTGELLVESPYNLILAKSNFLRSNRDLEWLLQGGGESNSTSEVENFVPLTNEVGLGHGQKRALEHFRTKFDFGLWEENLSGISKLAEYCHSLNVDLILLCLPKRSDYRKTANDLFPTEKRSLIRADLNSAGIKFFDFSELSYPDSLFTDGDHLNKAGADRLFMEYSF